MTAKTMDDAAGARWPTLRIPTHMAAPSHALVLREGPRTTRSRGRIPRVARLLALAPHFEELLETGAVGTQAELAGWVVEYWSLLSLHWRAMNTGSHRLVAQL
jgi:hypothetical protein